VAINEVTNEDRGTTVMAASVLPAACLQVYHAESGKTRGGEGKVILPFSIRLLRLLVLFSSNFVGLVSGTNYSEKGFIPFVFYGIILEH
jgi:hypothetical protein